MITLILGGARSGKSAVAESLARQSSGPVTYVATGVVGDDADFAARVAEHRARRPADWDTLEVGAQLAEAFERAPGTVLVDSLGAWLAATRDFAVDADALLDALEAHAGDVVVVSDEVGLGVHAQADLVGDHDRVTGVGLERDEQGVDVDREVARRREPGAE